MNLSECKYHVYSINGLLLNRVDFAKEFRDRYGEPYSNSNNGQIFLFRKNKDELKKQLLSPFEQLRQLMTFTVVQMTINKLHKIKQISVYDAIINFIAKNGFDEQIQEKKNTFKTNSTDMEIRTQTDRMFKNITQATIDDFKFNVCVNNDLDFLIVFERA